MEHSTVRQVATRIADYRRPPGDGAGAERSGAPISVILHGGEPLLVGHRHLDGTLKILRDALEGTGEVAWGMQTNGVLLGQDPELLTVLRRYGVRVGVSLDGTAAGHDRYRKFADGRGSHGAVARALRILGDGADRELFSGVLCTVDLDADPVETYEALLEFSPPRMDLLLPHGTWDVPPPGLAARRVPPGRPPGPRSPRDGSQDGPGATPYADWLCAVFDRWYGAPRRETGIRLFEELIMLLLGGRASSEMVGNGPLDLVVVETDGSLELADSLKVSYDGAAATPLDVFRDPFAVAEAHPAFRSPELSPVCASCPLVAVCGGGLYAHRYNGHGPGDPFAHPTVYCADMAALIGHIRRRLEHDLARLRERRPAGSAAR